MKSLYALILLVSVYFCSGSSTVNAQTITDSIHHSSMDQDSIPGIMLLSAEGEEDVNPFGRIIPCSPQAASLARYAEYPVSLTTGIPDITIPLYEIRMGEFTLPITISYHASGARPDEVPSCIEKTGPDPEQARPHFTTAWYVSLIDTPYGTINFKYRDMDDKFYVRHTSTYYRSGFYPQYEPRAERM